MTSVKPFQKVKIEGATEELEREVNAILYAVALIRQETGHGTLVIEIKDERIADMQATHMIRPKFLYALP